MGIFAGSVLPNKIPGSEWQLFNIASIGGNAVVIKAAGGPNVRNIITLIAAGYALQSGANALNNGIEVFDNGVAKLIVNYGGPATQATPPLILSADPVYIGDKNTALSIQTAGGEGGWQFTIYAVGYQIADY